jgi:hypothetical protein
MSDFKTLADFLDFNYCRKVKFTTGLSYYALISIAPIFVPNPKTRTSFSGHFIRKVDDKHIRKVVMSTSNGIDRNMLCTSVEGFSIYLSSSLTVKARFLLSHWRKGTLLALPRFVDEEPYWVKKKPKSTRKPSSLIKSRGVFEDDEVKAEYDEEQEAVIASTDLVSVTRMSIGAS